MFSAYIAISPSFGGMTGMCRGLRWKKLKKGPTLNKVLFYSDASEA